MQTTDRDIVGAWHRWPKLTKENIREELCATDVSCYGLLKIPSTAALVRGQAMPSPDLGLPNATAQMKSGWLAAEGLSLRSILCYSRSVMTSLLQLGCYGLL